ncbi:YceD family protein [Alkalihalobacillus pseudalcaliphilus]|uniref:YceD family protein n=1 Tax=Alkalihalobacillus pseudalcaliphilus TaxID=79884 RepID=UPI00064DE71C|nr:YceD family protein [Alkalihalobacillus pseudalcaliphilus]KMK77103.1 hypothetical protein AB990_06010 [Alkalihalobacillus pseudalcaliphilus]
MIWSLQELQAAKQKPLIFKETIELSELKELEKDIRAVAPVQLQGQIDYVKNFITFSFNLQTELTLPCSRTLVDVPLSIDKDVVERFQLEGFDSFQIDEERLDDDVHSVEGHQIDLKPYVMEQILLEIPMQIFADVVEEPKAPKEGKDWEIVTEEDLNNRIDPRLADLAKFFDKE